MTKKGRVQYNLSENGRVKKMNADVLVLEHFSDI
jgi:hypothetical protein